MLRPWRSHVSIPRLTEYTLLTLVYTLLSILRNLSYKVGVDQHRHTKEIVKQPTGLLKK